MAIFETLYNVNQGHMIRQADMTLCRQQLWNGDQWIVSDHWSLWR